jgi:hypothetical protein
VVSSYHKDPVVGLLGALPLITTSVLVPLVPAVPDVPELPFCPEVPDEPLLPDVPELPACPLVPEVPDVPEGVIAYEADTALVDQLLVPNNDPVIPCVTLTEPLNIAGPIFVRVDEPDTVSDPVIVWLPTNVFDPVVANML